MAKEQPHQHGTRPVGLPKKNQAPEAVPGNRDSQKRSDPGGNPGGAFDLAGARPECGAQDAASVQRIAREQVEKEQEKVGPAKPSGEECLEEGLLGFKKESQPKECNAQYEADQWAGQSNPCLVPGPAGLMGNLCNPANAGQRNGVYRYPTSEADQAVASFVEEQAHKEKQRATEPGDESRWAYEFRSQLWKDVRCQRPCQERHGRKPRKVEPDRDPSAAEQVQSTHPQA
jgi:hypothetical protein